MVKRLRRTNFWVLQRIGSNTLLFYIDFIILLILAYDLYRFYKLTGLGMFDSTILKELFSNLSFSSFFIALLYLILIPFAVAFIVFAVPPLNTNNTTTFAVRNWFYKIHVFVTFLLFITVANKDNFNLLAGYSLSYSADGKPILLDNFTSLIYVFGFSPIVLSLAVNLVRLFINSPSNKPNHAHSMQWKLFIGLSDISANYMPNHNFRKWIVYFNSASMSPDISWVLDKSSLLRTEYQKKIPTTDDARGYLKMIAERCRQQLFGYLLGQKFPKEHWIDFYTGTSRAFEVILKKLPNNIHLVLSPFEHQSQQDVVKWYNQYSTNFSYEPISMEEKYIKKECGNIDCESRKIIGAINKVIGAFRNNGDNNDKPIAVLLSEVYYKTGFEVDVSLVIDEVRRLHPAVIFIIDASQAVGNIQQPYRGFSDRLKDADYYYFSTHKWLLSPNTCGVVVTKKLSRIEERSYDVFDYELPTSTIDPNTIFGLSAGLDFIFQEMTLEVLNNKSALIRDYFDKTMPECVQLVGNSSRSCKNFVAIRPASGYQWNVQTNDELLEFFKANRLDATAYDVKASKIDSVAGFWLRLSFPYFLERFQVDRLNRIIMQGIRRNA